MTIAETQNDPQAAGSASSGGLGSEMNLKELFLLVQRAKRAAQKAGLEGRGGDLMLPSEMRAVALDLESGKYQQALDFIKSMQRSEKAKSDA